MYMLLPAQHIPWLPVAEVDEEEVRASVFPKINIGIIYQSKVPDHLNID